MLSTGRLHKSIYRPVLAKEKEGWGGTIKDGPISASGHTWYKIFFHVSGVTGWASAAYLDAIDPPSQIFTIGSRVKTASRVAVRVRPGGDKVGVTDSGAEGTVVSGPRYREFNSTKWWWEVSFDDGKQGWSAAEFLRAN